jgi:hypothetical protein
MTKSIKIVLTHDLGAEEAKRRIETGMDALRRKFSDKIGSASVDWTGDTALVRLSALGQSAQATIEVLASIVNIEVHLPWLLGAFADKIQSFVQTSGNEALRLPPPS